MNMNKMIQIALNYAIFSMASGVYSREMTKIFAFTGKTYLNSVHSMLFTLGTIMFLILALFSINTNLLEIKNLKKAIVIYNIGVVMANLLLILRGTIQVLNINLSNVLDKSISGFAGLSHIITAIGMVMLFLILKKLEIKK